MPPSTGFRSTARLTKDVSCVAATGRVPWDGVGAVGKGPAAATATGLAAAGHLSTAVDIADLREGLGRQTLTRPKDPTMTGEMMSLRALLETSSDPALLRMMEAFWPQRR